MSHRLTRLSSASSRGRGMAAACTTELRRAAHAYPCLSDAHHHTRAATCCRVLDAHREGFCEGRAQLALSRARLFAQAQQLSHKPRLKRSQCSAWPAGARRENSATTGGARARARACVHGQQPAGTAVQRQWRWMALSCTRSRAVRTRRIPSAGARRAHRSAAHGVATFVATPRSRGPSATAAHLPRAAQPA